MLSFLDQRDNERLYKIFFISFRLNRNCNLGDAQKVNAVYRKKQENIYL